MHQSKFLQSTPVRIVIIMNLVLGFVFFTAGTVFYKNMSAEIVEHIDERLKEHFKVFENHYELDGKSSLKDLIQQHIDVGLERNNLYNLSKLNEVIVSNFNPGTLNEEIGYINAPDEDGDLEAYRFYTNNIEEFTFTVAFNAEDVDEISEVIFNLLLWLIPLSLTVSFGVGIVLTKNTQTRLKNVTKPLGEVAQGNLNARLKTNLSNDDINQFSKLVNNTLDQLQASVKSMQQVSNDIAHDLKTPINRLYIAIDKVSKKTSPGSDLSEELQEALNEAKGINETFEALLRISQIETKSRKASFKEVDLNAIISTLVDAYEPVAEDQGAQINFKPDDVNNHKIIGDKPLITQMIANLLDNALRHSAENVEINVSITSNETSNTIIVSDNGPGIPAEEYKHIFKRFYRLENSRTTPGNGLGLSMVQAIAELHTAKITLRDNKPGLKFSICFPLIIK